MKLSTKLPMLVAAAAAASSLDEQAARLRAAVSVFRLAA